MAFLADVQPGQQDGGADAGWVGFAVRIALDGAAALAELAAVSADCVLLDVMMPGASGFEVCRRIRETSQVPVLCS